MNGKEQMVVRDERRTGIKIVSLTDAAIIASIPEMHVKAITNITIMKDN